MPNLNIIQQSKHRKQQPKLYELSYVSRTNDRRTACMQTQFKINIIFAFMLLFICLICLLVYNIFIYLVARSLARSLNAIWNENRERARHTAPIAQCVTIYCKINCSIQNAITTPEERRRLRRAMCTIYEY